MGRVTVINASPRANGYTATLLSVFLSHCKHEIIMYNIYNASIKPCLGCGRCNENHQCFMDDTEEILKSIESSQYVVFASPVYNYSFPSPMKAFLDRLQPFFNAKKTEEIRKGFLLVTAGVSGKYSFEIMQKQSKIAFSELSAEFSGSFLLSNTDKDSSLHNDIICEVENLAYDFFKA